MPDNDHGQQLVPFGKYKGQPVDVLAADSDYCEWLVGQPWFKTKFSNVYNVVVQYGTDTFDTPEHNQMQAAFLDDDPCWRLARKVLPQAALDAYDVRTALGLVSKAIPLQVRRCATIERGPGEVIDRQFELDGWDAVFRLEPAWAHPCLNDPLELPDCQCGECDHSGCPPESDCRGGERSYACEHQSCKSRSPITPPPDGRRYIWAVKSGHHCSPACPWNDPDVVHWFERLARGGHIMEDQRGHRKVYVECKPDLGDDYPGVLRQVSRFPVETPWVRVVLVRRFGSEAVTWEQAQKIFAASQVALVRESELNEPEEKA